MRRIITVQFWDGSGWLFTRAPGDFWYSQTIKAGGFLSPDRGIIPDDVRRRLINTALDSSGTTITTRNEGE